MSMELGDNVRSSILDLFSHPENSTPEQRHLALREAIKFASAATFIAIVIFIICGVLYFGSAWKPTTAHMDFVIIQADPGVVLPIGPNGTVVNFGEQVVSAITTALDSDDRTYADWEVRRTFGVSEYNEVVDDELLEEEVWGVLEIPVNYTTIYLTAMNGFLPDYPVGPTYDNTLYVALNSGQHPVSVRALNTVITGIMNAVNLNFAKLAASGAVFPFNLNAANYNATVSPVTYEVTTFNQHPLGTNFILAMGLIFIWAGSNSLVSVMFSITEQHQITDHISPGHLFLLRWTGFLVAGFFLSLTYTIIMEGFNTGFASGFGVVWMFSWLIVETFMAILIFLHRAIGLVGALIMSPLMILQITLSGSFVDTVMLDDFYSWGIPWPWTHAYLGLRAVVLGSPDSMSGIGLNVGVLFIWATAFTIGTGVAWYFRTAEGDWNNPNSGAGRLLAGLSNNTTGTGATMGGAGG
mmetsp:Transcript_17957/g.26733  ORF Transcript_17957/g.26733 Transcript_17957/m.26733 type:complete len:467 (+) Transcript_17957:1-1401(+)